MKSSRPIWPSKYEPSPTIPQRFKRGLGEFGGYNLYGEPNYVVTWAMDAEFFENDDPHARKYPGPYDLSLGHACFWLERWAAPEFFDKRIWGELRYGKSEAGTGKTIDILGPFPSRGAYIGVGPLAKDDAQGDIYEMLPLTTGLLEIIKQELDPGATADTVRGRLETGRRVRRARSAADCQKQLDAERARIRAHEAEINAAPTRDYVGLLSSLPQSVRAAAASLDPSASQYLDKSGATHTLWRGPNGSGNAQIDFTL